MYNRNVRGHRGFIIAPKSECVRESAPPGPPVKEQKKNDPFLQRVAMRFSRLWAGVSGLWAGVLAFLGAGANGAKNALAALSSGGAAFLGQIMQSAKARPGRRGRVLKTAAGAAAVLCVILIMPLVSDVGYDVYFDGLYIGTVANASRVEDIISDINDSLKTNKSSPLSGEALYFLRLIPKGGFSEQTELWDALCARTGETVEGYVLKVDENAVFAMESYDRLYSFLKNYKESFAGAGADCEILFDRGISIETAEISPAFILDEERAAKILSENINVSTYEKRRVTEIMPFDTQIIEDATLLIGSRVVVSPGQEGERQVDLCIIKENGAKVYEGVLAENILQEPVTRVERVGTKPEVKDVGTGAFIRPYSGAVSSRYGMRWGKMHKGIDFAGSVGDPIKAADNGVVTFAGVQNGFGKMIIIDHNNGYETAYGHCSSLEVGKGDKVEKGCVIAKVGNTGKSTGPHLHFEIRKGGAQVDPEGFIDIK